MGRRPGLATGAAAHGVAELAQPVPDPGLDRAERHLEQVGDLEIGMPVVEGEHDGFTLHGAQVSQAPANLLALQGGLDQFTDRLRVRHRGESPLPVGGGGNRPDPVDGPALPPAPTIVDPENWTKV